MDRIRLEPQQVELTYRGNYAEPAFEVLGNPARLLSNLLKRLGVFGATPASLNINVSVLAQANVTCFLPGAVLRVGLDHLAGTWSNYRDEQQVIAVLGAFLSAALETDPALRPQRHNITYHCWTGMKDVPFSKYIQAFAVRPPDAPTWKPAVEFSDADPATAGSVYLAEAATIPEGLFVRSQIAISGPLELDELVKTYKARLDAQLAPIGLEVAR